MKKIKSVKLKKDYSTPSMFISAGEKLIKNNCCNWESDNFVFGETYMEHYPDFFNITYEDEWFEVGDEKTEYIILGDGTIYDFINNNTCHYKQGNAGTKAEMEYRKMHNETMHYFRKLAEELNGDWRYEVGKRYNELMLQPNKPLGLYPRSE